MKKLVLAIMGLFLFCTITPLSYADLAIDTGIGGQNRVLNYDQWFAAEFFSEDSDTITSIEAFIAPWFSGELTIALYNDGGDLPGSVVHSDSFIAGLATTSADWIGLNGLSWAISPQSYYWVAFEVHDPNGFDGDISVGAPAPLGQEAIRPYGLSDYVSSDGQDISVRITGTTAVPIPSTLGLISFGIIGLICFRRKTD